jgi:hypothetical protein
MITLNRLKQRLATTRDEVAILEMLHIRADELVAAFEDKIIEYQFQLEAELFEDDDSDVLELDEDNR